METADMERAEEAPTQAPPFKAVVISATIPGPVPAEGTPEPDQETAEEIVPIDVLVFHEHFNPATPAGWFHFKRPSAAVFEHRPDLTAWVDALVHTTRGMLVAWAQDAQGGRIPELIVPGTAEAEGYREQAWSDKWWEWVREKIAERRVAIGPVIMIDQGDRHILEIAEGLYKHAVEWGRTIEKVDDGVLFWKGPGYPTEGKVFCPKCGWEYKCPGDHFDGETRTAIVVCQNEACGADLSLSWEGGDADFEIALVDLSIEG